eukprot:scaffold650745_cov43-Prasinocladus_malaysianus.AAC.1
MGIKPSSNSPGIIRGTFNWEIGCIHVLEYIRVPVLRHRAGLGLAQVKGERVIAEFQCPDLLL